MVVKQVNYGHPVVFPFLAKEGDITMVKTQTATGTIKGPSVASPLSKGDLVEITADLTVTALSTGVCIGTVYNEGKWVNGEPRSAMNQSSAVSAGALREVGIETFFKKIMTVPATGTVAAGNYVAPSSSGWAQTASSGATKSDYVALTAKDSNGDIIVGVI